MINKRLISGVFEGKEYIGHITLQGEKFVGSVHQVPEADEAEIFFDHSTGIFDTFEEAEAYVMKEWNRRFGD
ncbi:hypothetical protein NC797_02990 [Aquibacillus sp. 3ASR75-11]|uniref:Uncharacterized protein n=1 Tax=Terrihalobacillus insolitus TaxID=2950438 RepID=A0A9X3WSJ4_9BACI|nr:hypothetical protein [Terrihalobacillus insolitus]MDC3423471.1 hypothetical protein [Terrihalobacillus insolitus]